MEITYKHIILLRMNNQISQKHNKFMQLLNCIIVEGLQEHRNYLENAENKIG